MQKETALHKHFLIFVAHAQIKSRMPGRQHDNPKWQNQLQILP